jgi:hypothetical protein
MWKRLNNILHDKNDYHMDPTLQRDSEIADELLHSTIKYQKNLISRKVKYFFSYDKMFFLRLLARWTIKLSLLLIGLFIVSFTVITLFDLDINVKKIPKMENYTNFPIYIESTGDYIEDSILIEKYKIKYTSEASYIIFYPEDNSKDFDEWKKRLHGIESGGWKNPYEARRPGSQYWGKYQMGTSARKSIKMESMTWEEWKNNPEVQEAAMRMWVDILYDLLESYIIKYNGKFLNGWSITESGIIAMAHNVGPEPVKEFLNSGGKKVPNDGSGKPATRFLILGNYDLEINKNE